MFRRSSGTGCITWLLSLFLPSWNNPGWSREGRKNQRFSTWEQQIGGKNLLTAREHQELQHQTCPGVQLWEIKIHMGIPRSETFLSGHIMDRPPASHPSFLRLELKPDCKSHSLVPSLNCMWFIPPHVGYHRICFSMFFWGCQHSPSIQIQRISQGIPCCFPFPIHPGLPCWRSTRIP